MTAMPSIPGGLSWDTQDRLQSTDHQGGGVTYYVYDSAGLRVRKVHRGQALHRETIPHHKSEIKRASTRVNELLSNSELDAQIRNAVVNEIAGNSRLLARLQRSISR